MFFVVVLSLLTMLSLVSGVVLASVGGTFYDKYKNKIMLLRVALQAITIACAVLLIK
ncbi:hypothetical protein [Anaplasma bovis]|uniref:hypothetical protein n=1 Tax=Anaplasma bovis TaxID=186733 RepID=UPI002FF3284D